MQFCKNALGPLALALSLLSVLWAWPCVAGAQGPVPPGASSPGIDYVTVDVIRIGGNKRTKQEVILRELDFGPGDTISLASLTQRLQRNELKIMNMGLFTSAKISFEAWQGATNRVGLAIEVMESWYVFPFPIMEMADRNFNVWWDTYDHSLRRLNLGLRFYHTNFTGRKDQLKTVLQFGFTRKYELIYTLPYFNKKKTLGLHLNFLHTREKEIGFNTVDNELLYHRNADSPLLRRLRFGGGLLLRRKLDFSHQWNLTFHRNTVHESVPRELNPDFFLHGRQQQFLALQYKFTLDRRDIRPYPMKGYLLAADLAKLGLRPHGDINALNLTATMQQYFSHGKRWSTGLGVKGRLALLRNRQPYYNSTALGYFDDFIRGYEYYVVDGLDYAFQKSTVRFQLLDRELNWGRYMALPSFKKMPAKLFLSWHNEFGFANNPYYGQGNSLSNQLLWGTGLGLDLVLYYNKVFQFEVSRNHLNEYGFFLHWNLSF